MPQLNVPARRLSGAGGPGRTLHEEVRRLGHVLDVACGGNALCGTCRVLVVEGSSRLSPVLGPEADRLREMNLEAPYRLACQARLEDADGEITIVAC